MGHGGYREGSGRPAGVAETKPRTLRQSNRDLLERLERLQRSGNMATTSGKVLSALGSAEYWLRLIAELEREREWVAIAHILKFHMEMDEGKAAQRIHITSTNVNVSADELERVRATVRELLPREPLTLTANIDDHLSSVVAVVPNVVAEQGAEKDGEDGNGMGLQSP